MDPALSNLSHVVPKPREISRREGSFEWGGKIAVVLEPGNAQDRFAASTLLGACRLRGLAEPEICESSDAPDPSRPKRIIVGDPTQHWPLLKAMRAEGISIPTQAGDQGYALLVTPDTILVAGNTAGGVYYGIQTLIQLLPEKIAAACDRRLPALLIHDWPGVRHRGISIDSGRGQTTTPAMLRENVRRLGHFKMNMLVLYFEDGFLFPSHPDIGEFRDRLTTDEAIDLAALAAQHHVEIVPCFDTPGHMGGLLGHPNYAHLAEGTNIAEVIDTLNPETGPLLADLVADVCRAFPGRYYHMGGDEALGLGRGHGRAVADEVGAATLFVRHVKFVHDIVSRHGKQLMLWADPFEPDFFKVFGIENYGIEALKHLPRDIIMVPWHYGRMHQYPFGLQLAELGFEQHIQTAFGASSFMPRMNGAGENVETFVPFAAPVGATGIIHSDWDNRPTWNTFTEYNWPSAVFFAEWAWGGTGRPWQGEGLRAAVECFYGPGTGQLAETLRFIGAVPAYFAWSTVGIEVPGFNLMFGPLEPQALSDGALALLSNFRKAWHDAKARLARARSAAIRNVDQLDYFEHAFTAMWMMAGLVEVRHLMSARDAESRERLVELLHSMAGEFARLWESFESLWLRLNKPLALEGNRKNYDAIRQGIEQVLASMR